MILNLTQHAATDDQIAAGVTEPDADSKAQIQRLLTFDEPPLPDDVVDRARVLARVTQRAGATQAMIGGAPWLMAPLERALRALGITPLYSFTRRETVEVAERDGRVRKTQMFRHVCFLAAVEPPEER